MPFSTNGPSGNFASASMTVSSPACAAPAMKNSAAAILISIRPSPLFGGLPGAHCTSTGFTRTLRKRKARLAARFPTVRRLKNHALRPATELGAIKDVRADAIHFDHAASPAGPHVAGVV